MTFLGSNMSATDNKESSATPVHYNGFGDYLRILNHISDRYARKTRLQDLLEVADAEYERSHWNVIRTLEIGTFSTGLISAWALVGAVLERTPAFYTTAAVFTTTCITFLLATVQLYRQYRDEIGEEAAALTKRKNITIYNNFEFEKFSDTLPLLQRWNCIPFGNAIETTSEDLQKAKSFLKDDPTPFVARLSGIIGLAIAANFINHLNKVVSADNKEGYFVSCMYTLGIAGSAICSYMNARDYRKTLGAVSSEFSQQRKLPCKPPSP